MALFRRISCTLAVTLSLCMLVACQSTPRQLTFQVIDASGAPLHNIQVDYGISSPETTKNIGFTNKEGLIVWNDPPTGKQRIYIWNKDTPNGEPEPQYIPLKIRRSDFGATITLQAEWEASESVAKATPSSSHQSTRK